jgi:hypothetical protein
MSELQQYNPETNKKNANILLTDTEFTVKRSSPLMLCVPHKKRMDPTNNQS